MEYSLINRNVINCKLLLYYGIKTLWDMLLRKIINFAVSCLLPSGTAAYKHGRSVLHSAAHHFIVTVKLTRLLITHPYIYTNSKHSRNMKYCAVLFTPDVPNLVTCVRWFMILFLVLWFLDSGFALCNLFSDHLTLFTWLLLKAL